MLFHLPRLSPGPGASGVLLRIFTCVILAIASVYLVHQQARTHVSLSGDEYYFYYAAAHRYVDNPSDPVWLAQDVLRRALGSLDTAAEGDASCDKATLGARSDLRELIFLLQMETGSQGYGPGSVFHGAVLHAWEVLNSARLSGEPYATQLGRRIEACIAGPMVLVILACFLGVAFRDSVTVACALGLYVVVHSLVPPAAEAYWTGAEQRLQSAWWIVSTAVGLPFFNPRYSDSLVALAPRGYLVLPFLLALGLRWAGAIRWSYAVAAILPLFHPPIGTMIFAMICGVDLLVRPQVFADRILLAITIAALLFAATGQAGAIFLALAGSRWFIAAVLVALLVAIAYAIWMPRQRRLRAWSERASANILLVDVVVFGPAFLAGWFVLAWLFVRYGIVTPYGLVNLATKSAPVAHHVFFFGLLCIGLTWILRWAGRTVAENRLAMLALLLTAAATSVLVVAFGRTTSAGGSLQSRFVAIARAHDATAGQRPLSLGAFETHLLWHRIVRQRETGGDWVRSAVDLSPFRAQCPRL